MFSDEIKFCKIDTSAIVTNTFLQYSLANTDHCICVSHTGKENTVLR
jgi:phosphatidylinositol glycan class A protein